MVSGFAGGWRNSGLVGGRTRRSAGDHPQFVVRQVADDPERLAVVAALASENLNGEPMQLQTLSHRTSGRLIRAERVRSLKGEDEFAGRSASGSKRHRGSLLAVWLFSRGDETLRRRRVGRRSEADRQSGC